jgi:hypothetical protein
LAALMYCVLFNKDEFYPWALFCFGFSFIVYLISFYTYLYKNRNGYLAISLITYAIGLFTYEIGVALPVIFFFYDFLLKKDFKKSFFYAIPLAFCLIVRKTQWFGYGHVFGDHGFGNWGITSLISHSVEFLGVSGFMIFRQILYAIKGWETIGILLIVIIVIIVMFLYLLSRKMEIPNTPRKYNYTLGLFILVVIAAFIFPYILQGGVLSGGVATRSFIFIDIGIALFLTSLVILLSRFSYIKIIILILIGLSMLLCQGLYMNWVVSGTIQEDVYTYIDNHTDQISEYDLIYFNTTSFVRNKPNAIDETVLYPIAEFFFKVAGRDSAALEQRRTAQQGKLDGSVLIREYDRYYNAKCLDEYALADMLYKKVDNFNRTKLVYGKMSVNIPLEVTSGFLVYETSYTDDKIKTVNMSQVLDINYGTIYTE